MAQHPDVRIIGLGLRRCQQDEAGVKAGGEMCSSDQLPADASSLKGVVDGQLGEIRAVAEVRDRPRHANQEPV